jgi:outer membrane immunogenic protein
MLIFLATVAATETGCAADLAAAPLNTAPVIAAANWTELYLGVEGGGGIGSANRHFSIGTSTGSFEVDGAIAGGTIGYNKQWGSVVAGLEGDFSWSNVDGRTSCPNRNFTCGINTTWLATVRPRIGYALGNFMPYVTGGLAASDVNIRAFLNSTGAGAEDFTKTQLGWTAGGGVEVAVFSNWSLKAEYLYVRFADTNGPSSNGLPSTTNFSENIIRGGLNYSLK